MKQERKDTQKESKLTPKWSEILLNLEIGKIKNNYD
jgi:hypothetical protein